MKKLPTLIIVGSKFQDNIGRFAPSYNGEMSIKTAAPDHPILDLFKERWSPRAFSGRRIAPETLRSLFEAARWSASCFNEQPWRLMVASIDDTEAHERLASCLMPGNAWAKLAPV